MSLRDQLLKAGLATKKDVAKVNRELKQERRQEQAHQKPKAELRREAEEAARAEAEAIKARARARRERDEARAAAERALQIRQIARSHALRGRGNLAYHVLARDGRTVARLLVSERVAFMLRCGEVGVVELPAEPGRDQGVGELIVVSRRAAVRLREIDPDVVRLLVDDTRGISAPDEAFLVPEWDISLRPRRLR